MNYRIDNDKDIFSPALIYYKDIIVKNTEKTIEIAGDVNRLWPHVKSHKIAEMVQMQMGLGISRFKCATIMETKMAASCGAKHVMLAFPLVGPDIGRFVDLIKAYPDSVFWAIGDDLDQLKSLGESAVKNNLTINVLVDVNVGMNRTGVCEEDVIDFYVKCSKIEGLNFQGLHCYDGHLGAETKLENRQREADQIVNRVMEMKKTLESKDLNCSTLVMGGTPTFPCYAKHEGLFLSPGTIFTWDYGYKSKFEDMDFAPGAVILTRVVSCPGEGRFTLDLGHKHISTDSKIGPGHLLDVEGAVGLPQSEEHWPYELDGQQWGQGPKVGDVLYVIPSHICPTNALYPRVLVAEEGRIISSWKVVARDKEEI